MKEIRKLSLFPEICIDSDFLPNCKAFLTSFPELHCTLSLRAPGLLFQRNHLPGAFVVFCVGSNTSDNDLQYILGTILQ
jgi:hypothetical protein